MIKSFFAKLLESITTAVRRFWVPFVLSVCVFGTFGSIILFQPSEGLEELLVRIGLTLILGLFVGVFGKLLSERWGVLWMDIVLVAISGFAYLALGDFQQNQFVSNGYFGVLAALFMGILWLLLGRDPSTRISYLIKSVLFYGFVCGIVLAGTSLCILAFDTLIYAFKDSYKLYGINTLFIWSVLFVNLMLGALPRQAERSAVPRLFQTIVLYVAFPVYLLLISILYVYLGKILVTQSFPSGQVNWFASFASLFFVFFIFTLRQYAEQSKLASFWIRFGGWVMFPIFAVQLWGMCIRLQAYGLTEARYASLVLNGIALLFAVLSLVRRARYIRWLLPALAAASLVLTLTPFNLIDVPARNQTARLVTLLEQHSMLKDGAIVANADVPEADQIKITSAYQYLKRSDATLPQFLEDSKQHAFLQVFGFEQAFEKNYAQREYGSYHAQAETIDVEGYKTMYRVEEAKHLVGKLGTEEQVQLRLQEMAQELYKQYGLQSEDVAMKIETEQGTLHLQSLYFRINQDGSVQVEHYSGYFLER